MGRTLALGLALLAACGSGTVRTGGDGGGPGGADASTCAAAGECPSGQVCDPALELCVDALPCSTHADCGNGAFCDPTGACSPSKTGSPCATPANCPSGQDCIGGFCGCMGEVFAAEPVSSNVLIVLDRSGSMDDLIGGTRKWDIATSAIATLLASYGDRVRFGLVMYSSDADCGPGLLEVDVGDMTATAINGALAASGPAGRTPTGDTLAGLTGYAGLEDTARDNYVLLITDGMETCNGDGVAAVTALRAETPEIKTFVVGFGGEVDAATLDAMAQAGGTARPSAPFYYQADSAAELMAAFDAIGGSVLSCSYQLMGTPADPADLYIYFDGAGVTRDTTHTMGWDYDPATNQITFYGADCTLLRTGQVTDLVLVYGCPIG